MFNVMSITKSAIGLMYHRSNVSRATPLFLMNGLTVGEALNMMSGFNEETAWDYEAFRNHRSNITEYTLRQIQTHFHKPTRSFMYSNLLYQWLACAYEGLTQRHLLQDFRDWMGTTKGWKWEQDEQGVPLGPHGLYMTEWGVQRYATRAQPLLSNLTDMVSVPRGFWGVHNWNDKGDLKHYWNGWFLSDRWAYAIGHRAQVIAVSTESLKYEYQLIQDMFDGELEMKYYFFIDNLERSSKNKNLLQIGALHS